MSHKVIQTNHQGGLHHVVIELRYCLFLLSFKVTSIILKPKLMRYLKLCAYRVQIDSQFTQIYTSYYTADTSLSHIFQNFVLMFVFVCFLFPFFGRFFVCFLIQMQYGSHTGHNKLMPFDVTQQHGEYFIWKLWNSHKINDLILNRSKYTTIVVEVQLILPCHYITTI